MSKIIKEYKPNYLNTVIYKIYCKSPDVNDVYVGHSTNFKIRAQCHKYSSKKNILRLYQIIRKKGGWGNFIIEIIEKYPCENLTQALEREQYFYNLLQPTMNSMPPINLRAYKPKITRVLNLKKINENLGKRYNFYLERNKKKDEEYFMNCKLNIMRNTIKRLVISLFYLIKNNNNNNI
jgi:hypothetical protein